MKYNSADKWFSIYIRLRDSDDNGICKCVTCGKMLLWKNIDCGHYVKRQYARFNEKNCHCQCRNCNWLKQGNDHIFYLFIIEKYGQQTHDLLKSSEKSIKKYTPLEFNLITKEYMEKSKLIAKEKGIVL